MLVPPGPGGIDRTIYASPLTGAALENVTIAGRGVLDGNGLIRWESGLREAIHDFTARRIRYQEHRSSTLSPFPVATRPKKNAEETRLRSRC